jgi:type IV pilus assembly protein PilO
MKKIDFAALTVGNIGEWPVITKLAALAISIFFIVLLGYELAISDQLQRLHYAQQRELTLRQTFALKQQQATNAGVYQQQLKTLQKDFSLALGDTNKDKNFGAALENISLAGNRCNVQFKTFKFLPEETQELVARLPLQIAVGGNYQQIVCFVDAIAQLQQFIVLQDFIMANSHLVDDGRERLEFNARLMAYYFF